MTRRLVNGGKPLMIVEIKGRALLPFASTIIISPSQIRRGVMILPSALGDTASPSVVPGVTLTEFGLAIVLPKRWRWFDSACGDRWTVGTVLTHCSVQKCNSLSLPPG